MAREGDVVLIYYQGKPSAYARIESIEFDVKPGWFQVILMIFAVPSREIIWILRENYINGEEFTVDNIPIRLELVPLKNKHGQNAINAVSKEKKSNETTIDKPAKILAFRKPEQQKE